MEINGITFDPSEVTEILYIFDEAVTVNINDNTLIVFRFETKCQAENVAAQIKNIMLVNREGGQNE